MKLQIRHFIDSGHILPDTEFLVSKGCARLHGHTYAVIVDLEASDHMIQGGMLIDFKAIKEVIDKLDHKTLVYKETHQALYNSLLELNFEQVVNFPYIPSSENITRFLAESIWAKWSFLEKVTVSVCEGYKGKERANWTTHSIK